MGMIDGIRSGITNLTNKISGKISKADPYYADKVSLTAREGVDVMLTPNLRTFDNYARVGEPYLKAAKKIAPRGTPERIMAEAGLSARGESGKYAAYYTAMKALYSGIHGPISTALSKAGLEALMDSHFKTYQQGVDSGKPFLEAIKEHAKSDSINGILARTALRAKGETGKYGAYKAVLNSISNGTPFTEMETIAQTGFKAMCEPSFKYFENSNDAGRPFLKELKSRAKSGTVEYYLAKAALKTNGEVSQCASYTSAMKHIFIGTGKKNTISETLAVAGLEAFNDKIIKTYAGASRAARPFLEAIKASSPKNSHEYKMASIALEVPADDNSYDLYRKALTSLQPRPKPYVPPTPPPPAPKKPEGPKPLDFLEDKKKEIVEGKKEDDTAARIKILEDSVNIGGVRVMKRKQD